MEELLREAKQNLNSESKQEKEDYLLHEPRGIGPGQLLALLAKGNVVERAACHKHSPRNRVAHCFLTQHICTHSETGTRMKISIRR